MINRDPKCVFVADSLGLAEVVAGWLTDQGIPAQAMDTATLGGFDGLTWLSQTGVGARGIEVWVNEPAQAEEAKALLQVHGEALAAETAARADGSAEVEVVCEECGAENTFGGADRGKVQNCSQCGAHIDVPGADDALPMPEEEEEAGDEG